MKPVLPVIYALLGVGIFITLVMGIWNKQPVDDEDMFGDV